MKYLILETLNRPNMENEFDGQIAFLKQEKERSTLGFFEIFHENAKNENRI